MHIAYALRDQNISSIAIFAEGNECDRRRGWIIFYISINGDISTERNIAPNTVLSLLGQVNIS